MYFCSGRSRSTLPPRTAGNTPGGNSALFPPVLTPCAQRSAHRLRSILGRSKQQTHDALKVHHQARQHALIQHPRSASIAGMPHVVTPNQLGQLAFNGWVATTHLGVLRRLRLGLRCYVLRLVVVLGHRPALARLGVRQALLAQRPTRALPLSELEFPAGIVAAALPLLRCLTGWTAQRRLVVPHRQRETFSTKDGRRWHFRGWCKDLEVQPVWV